MQSENRIDRESRIRNDQYDSDNKRLHRTAQHKRTIPYTRDVNRDTNIIVNIDIIESASVIV